MDVIYKFFDTEMGAVSYFCFRYVRRRRYKSSLREKEIDIWGISACTRVGIQPYYLGRLQADKHLNQIPIAALLIISVS